jgi:hypothetical protein
MRCRGVHRYANPAYLGRFLFSGLHSVAPYCALSGVRVVSSRPAFQAGVLSVHLQEFQKDHDNPGHRQLSRTDNGLDCP